MDGGTELIQHIPRLRRYAQALTGDASRADDLVQDVQERAALQLDLWQPPPVRQRRSGGPVHAGQTGFRHARERGVELFCWIDGDPGYALSGPVERAVMQRLADVAYRRLAR